MWLLFALLTALFEAFKDAACKLSLKNVDEYLVSGSMYVAALPLLLPFLIFSHIPALSGVFWTALVTGTLLNVLTTLLYIKALKYSDMSLSLPMVTFTPVFLLLTSPLILGEFPGIEGIAGILLICLGAYTLTIRGRSRGFWKPLQALIGEKGPRYMLLVAFLWSITSNIDKVGILESTPLIWVASTHTALAICFVPLMLIRMRQRGLRLRKQDYLSLGAIGLLATVRAVFQMSAVALTLVAYVISVKRTSVIFGVFLGYLIFGEKGIRERLAGAILMVSGVFLIAWL